jgi:hypothetical protein
VSGARRTKFLPKKAGHDADAAPISSRRSLCLGPSSPTYELPVDKDKFHALYCARDSRIFLGFSLAATSSLTGIADCTSHYLYSLHSQGTNVLILVLGVEWPAPLAVSDTRCN